MVTTVDETAVVSLCCLPSARHTLLPLPNSSLFLSRSAPNCFLSRVSNQHDCNLSTALSAYQANDFWNILGRLFLSLLSASGLDVDDRWELTCFDCRTSSLRWGFSHLQKAFFSPGSILMVQPYDFFLTHPLVPSAIRGCLNDETRQDQAFSVIQESSAWQCQPRTA